ncbi:hypothetical protein ID866_7096 [Astraeus odoratus]|nr:hypothetical protein ID866_7096 [Astraeus odoratus]
MSDATGFAAGGTSNLITVGGPTGTSCDTTNPTPPYYFSTSSDLQQCSPFTFYGYEGAQLPVTILGLIPGGESFVIQDGVSVANYSWTVDVAAGISLLFSMIDAGGNTGGATAVTDVSPSSNSSCLNSNSPSSTASVPQSSTTSTTSASPNTSSDSSKISTATIIGVAAAGIIALAALVFLGLFLTRRRRKQRSMYSLATSRDVPLLQSGDLHRNPSSSAPNPHVYPFPYQATPVDPSFSSGQATPQTMTHDSPPGTNPNAHSFMGYTDTVNSRVSSSGSRKGSMTVLTTPTRYIVHTDAEDASSTPGEVIELPPQYSERRMPASLLSSSRPMSSISEQGSTDLAYASTAFTDVDSHPQLHPPP